MDFLCCVHAGRLSLLPPTDEGRKAELKVGTLAHGEREDADTSKEEVCRPWRITKIRLGLLQRCEVADGIFLINQSLADIPCFIKKPLSRPAIFTLIAYSEWVHLNSLWNYNFSIYNSEVFLLFFLFLVHFNLDTMYFYCFIFWHCNLNLHPKLWWCCYDCVVLLIKHPILSH